ncbi:MAG: hypothetical protein M3Y42_18600 [Actinomycetota bacterium]|nr:hypothetical protein [Actinomycetota bacterium]
MALADHRRRCCDPVRLVQLAGSELLWCLLFAGEGHGFRKADSVADSLRAEAELYSHTMGLTLDVNEVLT